MEQSQLDYGNSATHEYLRVIRQHVIYPLEMTPVTDSCFASAMLIFGSIDGLGNLIHIDPNAGAGDRFKHFLNRLGKDYAKLEDELWQLRNSLAHNAMNVACFMSKTDDARGEHLERDHGYVFVHTGLLIKDFKSTLDELEADFRKDFDLLQRAESRLEWDSIDKPGWQNNDVMTTPPPGINFVKQMSNKKKKKKKKRI